MLDNKRPFVQNVIRLSPILFALILFGVVFMPIVEARTVLDKTAVFTQGNIFTEAALAPAAGDITFDAAFLPDTIGPGSSTELRFTMTNSGAVNVTDMAFTNVLPAGIVIASPASAFADCTDGIIDAPAGGSTITFSSGRLPGNGASCSITVNVTSSTVGAHINVTGDLTSSIGNTGTATDTLEVVSSLPGFSKSFSPNVIPPDQISTLIFTIDNSNNPSGIASLNFTDSLPNNMIVADFPNASTDCGTPTFPPSLTANPSATSISIFANGFLPNFPALAAGATCTVTVDVTTTSAGIFNNVSGELTAGSSSGGFATASLTVQNDYLLKAFIDDPTSPGGTVTIQYTLKNLDRGNDATNMAFTDDLDSALSGLVATGLPINDVCGAGSQISGVSSLTFTGGSLTSSESCVFTVTAQIPGGAASGVYPSMTSALALDLGGVSTVKNSASDELTVALVPAFSKTFITNTVATGDTVILTFTITNTSLEHAATDIAFSDNFSAFLPGVSLPVLPASGSCGAGSTFFVTVVTDELFLNMTGGNLASGVSCTFDITFQIPVDASAGIYTNSTGNLSAIINAETVYSRVAVDQLQIVAGPRLLKEFTDDPVIPANTVTLSFTLSHDDLAPADATAIAFTDDLDATLTGLTAVTLPADGFCGPGSQLIGTSTLTVTGGTLTPGATCTFSVTLLVPLTASPNNYSNTTSEVSATVSGLATRSNAASDTLTVAGVLFTKTFVDDPVFAGQTATLEFTIENVHPTDAATAMSFTDNLSSMISGLAVTGALPVTPCGAGSSLSGTTFLIFVGGELAAGDSCTFSVDVLVPLPTADDTYRNTTGYLSATINGSPVNIDPATANLTVSSDYLEISKSFIDDPVSPGGNVTLAFTITNTHATTGTNSIAFTDDLEAALSGLTAVSLPADGFCGAGSQLTGVSTLTLSNASLPASASCTFTATLQVPASVSLGTTATNITSNVTGTTSGGLAMTGGTATDDLQIGFVSFSKTMESPSVAAGTSDLVFTIQNFDSSTGIANVQFSDDLDAVIGGLVATGLPATNVCGAGSTLAGTSFLTLTDANLDASGSCTFTVTLQIPAMVTAGSYLNTTSDLLTNGLIATSPATATLTIEPPPAFSKSFTPSSIFAGQTSTLLFTIDNSASALAATALDFTDNLPAGVVVATPASASTTCTGGTLTAVNGSGTISYSGGTVAANTTCTMQVEVTSNAEGTYVNTTGDLTSSSGNSGTASDTLTVNPTADLAIAKAVSSDPVLAGHVFTYTVLVTNNGPSDAQNVVVTDTLPAWATFGSTSGCAEDVSVGGVPTCTLGTITSGASISYTIQVTTVSNTNGVITNTATVTSTIYDPDLSDNTAEVSTDILGLDFGDAPDPTYPTLLANDGARHRTSGLYLGASLDLDDDGQPTATADGDDNAILDDEDGVTFTTPIVISVTAGVNITASQSSILNAWIDFNGNGSWADAGEQIFVDQSVSPGVNPLSFSVPTSAVAGTTFARFRLSSATGLSYTGYASDGEVEDYQVTIIDNRFSIGDVTLNEGNGGTTAYTFVITRTSTGSAASVDIQTANNTAVSTTDYTAIPLTTVNFINGGSLTQTVAVSVTGDLLFENDETFYLNLSNPVNGIIVDGQGVGTITNDDATPTLSINDMSVDEGAGTAVYTITLSAVSGLDVTVDYATSDGTAIAGDDYTAITNTATITAGATTATFSVSITDDALDENSETYTVTLSSAVNATIADGTGLGTITDNDATPTLSINDMSVDEGAGTAVYTITLSAVSGLDVAVDYATSDDTATAGDDYTAIANTAIITAGATTTTLSVAITDDALDENSETYTVTLSSPINATIADGVGLGTITDNDATPTLSINDMSVDEGAGTAVYTITLSTISGLDVAVNYASSDGTATAGDDYTAIANTATITAGTTTATFSVTITDDALDENSETYTVTLSSPVNATIADGTGLGTITDNDATPGITFSTATYEADEEGGSATITATLTASSTLDILVDFASQDGTATAGSDYTAISGTLSISAGETIATFTTAILSDGVDEEDETVLFTLSNAVNAILTTPMTTSLTIIDNDATIYLPIVLNNPTMAPDLVVTDLIVSNNQIQVTIENQGNRAVIDAFWIDVYIDPSVVPVSVNQTWPQVGDYGAVWGVDGVALPILSGETMTLTMTDSYYRASLSQLPVTIIMGTPVYVQVDSANANSSYGNVNEIHEINGGMYNNVFGPLISE